MIADCGFLDNIAYDYEKGVLTPDYEVKQMCESLTFEEQTKLIKHYNLGKSAGAGVLWLPQGLLYRRHPGPEGQAGAGRQGHHFPGRDW